MRVVNVQLDIAWEDKAANFRRVRELLDASPPPANSLIVLPEMFATGFSMNVAGIAEPADGETAAFLSELARDTGCTVVGGVVTRAGDGRGLNQAIVCDPAGDEIARYTKIHPFSYAGEDEHYAAGDQVCVFPWAGMNVGVFICYDLRFPEVYRHAVRAGAEVLVTIASFPASRHAHWRALNIARAIENQAWVAACNRCGNDPNARYRGGSLIVDPRGEVVAEGGDGEACVAGDADADAVARYRAEFPALADMR